MQNKFMKRSFSCGIIILFLGLSISSSISGTMNNESPNAIPTNSPLKNYVLGYWKFDECNGDTAYDSSGHDFDGKINGATWISYESGCALDFDGEDDFVELDAYSENLGMNKTDDLILSVHFNTATTKDMDIFSMSDAWNVENPELSIQMCSNGSILFKIWTLYCGLGIYSDEGYNDGDWHVLKIIFHGSTANPTLETYVDNNLDNSISDWLCDIHSDEFKRAKIGRRAVDSTKYYEGALDRLKIIKYPGGNEQPNPPVIDGDGYGLPDEELTFTFVSEDYEEDELEYFIDWGDGYKEGWFGPYASGEVFNRSHTYSEKGTYYVTARARDYWGNSYWTDPPFEVSIGNHAPFPPYQPSGADKGSINIKYTYSTYTTDAEEEQIWYMWDWGDGNFSDWDGPYESGATCEASHTWIKPDTYEVQVKAKDEFGESLWSDPLPVAIVISALEIGPIKGNLLTVNTVIKNIGEWEATDVKWNINLVGGIILTGEKSSGEIPTISVNQEIKIRSRVIIGFGPTTVHVTTHAPDGSQDTHEREAVILLFFIKINPGS